MEEIAYGRGALPVPLDSLVQENRNFSAMLWGKVIPNHLEIWAGQFGHDWPWWREHLRRFV